MLRFTTRPSDSSWVDAVWTCTSDQVSTMTSVASATWGLVFWQQDGRTMASVTGPDAAAGTAPVPEGATFTGIEFAVGTTLRHLPMASLLGAGVELDEVSRRSFRLAGHRWEIPGADDAECLVDRFVRAGVVGRDPLVTTAARDDHVLGVEPASVSPRTLQRRFVATTGLTRGAVRQIRRARDAARLVSAGAPPADVVTACGYFDEPHLARALRRYVGRTVGQLRSGEGGAIGLDLVQRTTS